MLFVFHDWNHCPQGQIAIADIIAIMAAQMEALGHQVVLPSDQNNRGHAPGPDVRNVLLEAFTDEDTIERIAADHARGCRFVYVATEEPSPQGFNKGNAYGMIDRQRVFPEAARYCDAILHLVPGQHVTDWYRQFAPAAYAELGHAPGLVRWDESARPDYDFGFFGQTTPRREEIFARLREVGSLLTEYRLELPRAERDALMRRARVIVTVRAQDNVDYVSSTRVVSSLCMGRPVLAEHHPNPGPWAQVVPVCGDLDDFLETAVGMGADWEYAHAVQYEDLRRVMTPERCLGDALRAVGLAGGPP